MYKVLKSSNTGVDEFDIEDMEKGCWIDIVLTGKKKPVRKLTKNSFWSSSTFLFSAATKTTIPCL